MSAPLGQTTVPSSGSTAAWAKKAGSRSGARSSPQNNGSMSTWRWISAPGYTAGMPSGLMVVKEEGTVATTVQLVDNREQYATPDEGRELFDYQARKLLNISGEDFLRRWDAGEYREIADAPGHRHIMRLAMLIPFGRLYP